MEAVCEGEAVSEGVSDDVSVSEGVMEAVWEREAVSEGVSDTVGV